MKTDCRAVDQEKWYEKLTGRRDRRGEQNRTGHPDSEYAELRKQDRADFVSVFRPGTARGVPQMAYGTCCGIFTE
ncbi:hypothetical protein SCATT_04620 [Streptantibioticus cattleyicolor NRRL 8057 = DSM 46488]|uniref:Uncharacterized protein n=1 Tax=Streptantibioticus cattleyicolor (strain ATCC 35852 / DSM 46488 / JCM 4925 / NBRC 14057 / NRRL 8057) TaxID=1003195 RepID=G8WPP5_STREN|nr:hypothetical protein SCATT_04620 [Streptantibioticus cattleyicolor NRRL 8057 = DSM 46488]